MKSAGPLWTPYEDERLRALAFSGTSAGTIAAQIKRSEAAVRKRAARLKVLVAKSRLKAKGNTARVRRDVEILPGLCHIVDCGSAGTL